MALEDGRPRFVFGAMGADGQPQTNVQVLHRLLTGDHPGDAVAAPRILHGRFLLEDDSESCRSRPTSTRTRWRRCTRATGGSRSCPPATSGWATPTRSRSAPTAR